MPSVADSEGLAALVARLEAVRPDAARRWGTMTPGEMLCHLGDAAASVLGRAGQGPTFRKRLMKWVALYSGLPWPRGARTRPEVDPKAGGTRPSDFEADRRRAIEGLRAVAAAPAAALPVGHFMFGAMTRDDWHRWAWRHTDHHLRQFGV